VLQERSPFDLREEPGENAGQCAAVWSAELKRKVAPRRGFSILSLNEEHRRAYRGTYNVHLQCKLHLTGWRAWRRACVRVVDVAQRILHSDARAQPRSRLVVTMFGTRFCMSGSRGRSSARRWWHDLYLARRVAVLGIFERQVEHRPGELAHRQVVARIADVVDLPRGDAAAVAMIASGVDPVLDIGEGALLPAPSTSWMRSPRRCGRRTASPRELLPSAC